MRVTISSVADFHQLAVPAYGELVASTGAGRPRLDVEFAPGSYSRGGMTLGEPPAGQAIDLDLHAADPRQPPRLVDVTLALYGRRIRLAELVFETGSDDCPALRLTVEHAIEIDQSAFIANRTGVRAGDRLLELVSRSGQQPAEASIRGSRFIRNYAPQNSTLMAFEARPPDAFGRILFQDVAFVANEAYCCVTPDGADAVDIHRCVLLEPPQPVLAPSASFSAFIAVRSPGTRVEFAESLIARRSLDSLVSRWSTRLPSPLDYQPVTIRDSRLVLDEAAARTPEGYVLARSSIEKGGGVFEDSERLASGIDALAGHVRRGARPHLSDLVELVSPSQPRSPG